MYLNHVIKGDPKDPTDNTIFEFTLQDRLENAFYKETIADCIQTILKADAKDNCGIVSYGLTMTEDGPDFKDYEVTVDTCKDHTEGYSLGTGSTIFDYYSNKLKQNIRIMFIKAFMCLFITKPTVTENQIKEYVSELEHSFK